MQTEQSQSGWARFFQWIILNFIGLVAGIILSLWVFFSLPYFGTPIEDFFLPGVMAGLLGIVLGAFQWQTLKKKIARRSQWGMATGLGLAIGAMIAVGGKYFLPASDLKLASPVGVIVSGIVIGTTLGTTQWVTLRGQIDRPNFWIIGSAIGMGLAFSLPQGSFPEATDALQASFPVIFFAFRAVIVYSVITGILLAWLLRINPE